MPAITELEWRILSNLSDDWECPATICAEVEGEVANTKRGAILRCLFNLHRRGLVTLQDGRALMLDDLLCEPEDNSDTRLWFGLTEAGRTEWESFSEKYCGCAVDWTGAWAGHISFESRDGYVDGTSREVCTQALEQLLSDGTEWEIDRDTLEHCAIEGFQAKYHKHLDGGHRICFRLKKK